MMKKASFKTLFTTTPIIEEEFDDEVYFQIFDRNIDGEEFFVGGQAIRDCQISLPNLSVAPTDSGFHRRHRSFTTCKRKPGHLAKLKFFKDQHTPHSDSLNKDTGTTIFSEMSDQEKAAHREGIIRRREERGRLERLWREELQQTKMSTKQWKNALLRFVEVLKGFYNFPNPFDEEIRSTCVGFRILEKKCAMLEIDYDSLWHYDTKRIDKSRRFKVGSRVEVLFDWEMSSYDFGKYRCPAYKRLRYLTGVVVKIDRDREYFDTPKSYWDHKGRRGTVRTLVIDFPGGQRYVVRETSLEFLYLKKARQ